VYHGVSSRQRVVTVSAVFPVRATLVPVAARERCAACKYRHKPLPSFDDMPRPASCVIAQIGVRRGAE
jgi:hypothetical protein